MTSAAEEALRSAQEATLETRGRRTGRPHRVVLWYAYEAPDVWLRGDPGADWLRNLEGDHSCLFIVGAHAIAATREQVADEGAALRHVVELWRSKYGVEWVADWYVERGRVPVRLRLLTR